jgi:hypothetical protein
VCGTEHYNLFHPGLSGSCPDRRLRSRGQTGQGDVQGDTIQHQVQSRGAADTVCALPRADRTHHRDDDVLQLDCHQLTWYLRVRHHRLWAQHTGANRQSRGTQGRGQLDQFLRQWRLYRDDLDQVQLHRLQYMTHNFLSYTKVRISNSLSQYSFVIIR